MYMTSLCWVLVVIYAIKWTSADLRVLKKGDRLRYKVSENQKKNFVLEEFNFSSVSVKIVDDKEVLEVNGNDLCLKKILDREEICISSVKVCVHEANLILDNLVVVPIEVTIIDVNDNAPRFEDSLINKSISESAEVGSTIRLMSAQDPDYGRFAVQSYDIASSDPDLPFSLNVFNNTIGSQDRILIPELKLTRALDRELKSRYSMKIFAFDGGSPRLNGSTMVTVVVNDVNDNKPKFEKSFYEVDVDEDKPPGTEIIQVSATDLDAGLNSQIRFCFSEQVQKTERLFKIDPDSGVISLLRKLDFENSKVHHLTVEARDIGNTPLSAYVSVVVNVKNVNDEAPKIKVEYLIPNSYRKKRLYISEDTEVGMEVAFITLTDGGGENVTCRLSEPSKFQLFKIDNEEYYYLKLKEKLDREVTRTLTEKLIATDDGSPPKTNITTITIEVTDINDNPPVFQHSLWNISAEENAKPGRKIGEVFARDLDSKENKRLTYKWTFMTSSSTSIVGEDQFELDEDKGFIVMKQTATSFDAEKERPWFLFNVTANDHGTPSLSASTRVNISVSDVNDNRPIFERSTYEFSCKENVEKGYVIGHVTASDDDVNKWTNGRVRYSIDKCGGVSPCPFDVDQESGQITFNGRSEQIDREARQLQPIRVAIRASDQGIPPMDSIADALITIVDVNDNVPVIDYPDVKRDIVYVIERRNRDLLVEDARTGRIFPPTINLPLRIATIRAHDRDQDVTLKYRLVDGDEVRMFDINPNNGDVMLNVESIQEIEYVIESGDCYVIAIEVSDQGIPPLSSIAHLNVYFTTAESKPLNMTSSMQRCRQSPFYPPPGGDDGDSASTAQFSRVTILVIVFSLLLLLLVVIMVYMIFKYRCRSKQKTRTYNCNDGGTSVYPGSPTQGFLADADRHSRAEDYYDQKDGLMRTTSGGGSSNGSVRDSGTGDSVPMELKGAMLNRGNSTANHQLNYQQPSHVYLPPQDGDYIDKRQLVSSAPREHMTSRCTQECQISGHGDQCWMPDSLQRAPSRMSAFQVTEGADYVDGTHPGTNWTQGGYNYPSHTYQNPSDLVDPQIRYTPYYYDPVSNFEQPHYRNSPVSHLYQHPLTSRNPSYTSQRSLYAQSPAPSSHVRYVQGKAYVNIQGSGYHGDEMHSNVSSTSSGNYKRLLKPHQQVYAPYDDMMGPYAETIYYPQQEAAYDEDFTAANLIMSPNAASATVATDDDKQSETRSFHEKTATSSSTSGEEKVEDDKLSTIREEIDAEEVIAGIDGLLL